MRIGGLQTLSLLDYPDRTSCTIFTLGCDCRCPFCHNSSLLGPAPAGGTISPEEVLAFLHTRRGLLEGVCITGGEPLLQDGLEDFLREIKALGFLLKLDTNGTHPARLWRLIQEGLLDYVAMDIKNTPQKYAQTVGLPGFDMAPVKESVSCCAQVLCPMSFEPRWCGSCMRRETCSPSPAGFKGPALLPAELCGL